VELPQVDEPLSLEDDDDMSNALGGTTTETLAKEEPSLPDEDDAPAGKDNAVPDESIGTPYVALTEVMVSCT
jgi:hypothetical protein